VLGVLIGVVLVLLGLIAYRESYDGRIMPGVQVGGVDVSGLTRTEARDALVAAFAPLEDGAVTVHSEAGDAVLPYDRLGRSVDIDAMVDRAAAVGRGGTRFAETVAGLRLLVEPVTVAPILSFDRQRVDDALAAYRNWMARTPIDADIRDTKLGYVIKPGADGVQVDTTGIAPAIETALMDPAAPASIVLDATASPVTPTITNTDAWRARSMAERVAADLVLEKGKKTWKIKAAQIRSWITFSGLGAGYAPHVDRAGVPAALKKAAKDLKRKPTEAKYLKTRSGKVFGVSASSLGRGLDPTATAAAVVAALDARAVAPDEEFEDGPVTVATMTLAPKLSTDEAKRTAPVMDLLGSWTTHYQSSAHNGFSANISIPARRLDGVVIKPGQVFDFWKAIGEVSFRTGYRLGGAIVGGHSVEGKALAGGICATSTTMFNAAARSGLQMLTRSPHWYYITRYPLGLDATVSGSQTMRFRNDTKYPILIKSAASPGYVHFELWSVPNGRRVTWSRPHVSNVVGGFDTVKKTSSLRRGQRERIEWPVDGKDVSISRTVRDANGRVIHRDTWVSHYHRMVGVTLVGTG
jgi:vancomycin resistance protein YoaR